MNINQMRRVSNYSVEYYISEYIETKRLYRHSGTYGEHGDRILADGLARASFLHCYAHENL